MSTPEALSVRINHGLLAVDTSLRHRYVRRLVNLNPSRSPWIARSLDRNPRWRPAMQLHHRNSAPVLLGRNPRCNRVGPVRNAFLRLESRRSSSAASWQRLRLPASHSSARARAPARRRRREPSTGASPMRRPACRSSARPFVSSARKSVDRRRTTVGTSCAACPQERFAYRSTASGLRRRRRRRSWLAASPRRLMWCLRRQCCRCPKS